MKDLQETKERIIDTLDPEDLVDRLNIDIQELVEILSDCILANIELFYDLEDNT